jgi:integration host factor subunit alpha
MEQPMSALSKAEIAQHLCEEMEVEKKISKQAVDCFFDVLSEHLIAGEAIKLSGFGNFVVRQKKERPGRNPKTGQAVKVVARRVATFKPGVKLKKLVGLLKYPQ